MNGSQSANGAPLVKFTVYAGATEVPNAPFRYFVIWGVGNLSRSAGPKKRLGITCKPLLMSIFGIPVNLSLLTFCGTVTEEEFGAIRAEHFQRVRWTSKDPWLALNQQIPGGLHSAEELIRENAEEAEVVNIYSSDEIRGKPRKRPVGKARARVKEES